MDERYYVDTQIWRDYYENRKDRFRPLGEWALRFFNQSVEQRDIIFYSGIVIDELKKQYDIEQIKKIFRIIPAKLLQKLATTTEQFHEALRLKAERKVPLGDAFHAVVARDNNAIVISRDRHFLLLEDIAPHKKPEELI
ncbi:MAG: PIN domain-containing protein [Nanoarchaeota archaeon]|nr:PIN domain-containing protein [Nanoarchaeota archaeon]